MTALTVYGQLGTVVEHDSRSQAIFDAISEGLTPFRPREIELSLEFDIDYNRYVITATVGFVGATRSARAYIDAFDLHDDPTKMTKKVSSFMFNNFRYGERFSIPRNVILGEQ